MSEQTKVDVLAVMRGAEELALCYSTERHTTAIREARAAVAELVEAATRYFAAIDRGLDLDLEFTTEKQLRAALARMGVTP